MGQKSISSCPLGRPAKTARMLDFVDRHKIETMAETFALERVNEPMEHPHSGKARLRIELNH
jgi:uncharacterized zinc-type alcohol dehydrogenase-like protein